MRNTVVLLAQLHYYSLWELIELFGWRWRRWLGARARLLRFFCNGKELSKNMAGRMSRNACDRLLASIVLRASAAHSYCNSLLSDRPNICMLFQKASVHRLVFKSSSLYLCTHQPYAILLLWYDKYLPSPAITAAAHPSPLTALN